MQRRSERLIGFSTICNLLGSLMVSGVNFLFKFHSVQNRWQWTQAVYLHGFIHSRWITFRIGQKAFEFTGNALIFQFNNAWIYLWQFLTITGIPSTSLINSDHNAFSVSLMAPARNGKPDITIWKNTSTTVGFSLLVMTLFSFLTNNWRLEISKMLATHNTFDKLIHGCANQVITVSVLETFCHFGLGNMFWVRQDTKCNWVSTTIWEKSTLRSILNSLKPICKTSCCFPVPHRFQGTDCCFIVDKVTH